MTLDKLKRTAGFVLTMKTDIVFPSGNEKEFADLARKLGYERLIFIYNKISETKKFDFELKTSCGILIKEKNTKNLVKKINQAKDKGWFVLVQASDDNFDRFVLEKTRADMVYDLELVHKKDAMHYRRSGLDQVLCKLTAEKGKKIGLNFWTAVRSEKLLGRAKQNIRFCKKYKVDLILASFADKPELMRGFYEFQSFLASLNLPIKKII